MADANSNDNDLGPDGSVPRGPDAHGQAAMLLVESLIHGLIARSVIGVGEAREIVTIASEISREMADELGDAPATMHKSIRLLAAIRDSLDHDL